MQKSKFTVKCVYSTFCVLFFFRRKRCKITYFILKNKFVYDFFRFENKKFVAILWNPLIKTSQVLRNFRNQLPKFCGIFHP